MQYTCGTVGSVQWPIVANHKTHGITTSNNILENEDTSLTVYVV